MNTGENTNNDVILPKVDRRLSWPPIWLHLMASCNEEGHENLSDKQHIRERCIGQAPYTTKGLI